MCHPSRCATRVALCTYARAAGLAVPRAAHPPGLLAGAASARLCHTGAAAAPTARPAGPVGTQRAQSGGSTPTRRGLPGGIPGTWSATTEHHFPGARQAELSLGCFPRSHRGAAPAHLECQGGHSPARGVERRAPPTRTLSHPGVVLCLPRFGLNASMSMWGLSHINTFVFTAHTWALLGMWHTASPTCSGCGRFTTGVQLLCKTRTAALLLVRSIPLCADGSRRCLCVWTSRLQGFLGSERTRRHLGRQKCPESQLNLCVFFS